MKYRCSFLATLAVSLVFLLPAHSVVGQDLTAAASAGSVQLPHLVNYSGMIANPEPGAAVTLKFSLYQQQTGGDPVWTESQPVTPDSKGRYAVLLGAATQGGLPQTVFNSAQARWLGISVADAAELPRIILVATPYSLKASDAETLAGHPITDFALAKKDSNGNPETDVDITDVVAGTGITVTGNGTSTVTVGINSTYLDTLASGYAALAAANTFKASQTIDGSLTLTGNITIDGTINSAYLNSLAAQVPTLKGNNTFSGTNKFSSPVTFAASQTFPGTVTLAGNNTFSGTETMSGASNDQLNVSTTGTGDIAILGTSTAGGTGVTGVSNYGSGNGVSGSGGNAGVAGLGNNYGLYGYSVGSTGTDAGVYGSGVANGVYGTASSGPGVQGVSPSTIGEPGVQGVATYTGGFGVGVIGEANGTGAFGAYGSAAGASGTGVYGYSTGANGVGTYGSANENTGTGVIGSGATGVMGTGLSGVAGTGTLTGVSGTGLFGVTGASSDASGYGILASNSATTGNAYGLAGLTYSPTGYGMYAEGVSASNYGSGTTGFGAGIWADTGVAQDNGGQMVSWGALLATADENSAASMGNNSGLDATLFLNNSGGGGTIQQVTGVRNHSAPVLSAIGPDGACGINTGGDIFCTGQLATAVPVAGGTEVAVYSVQSAENWFEDFGSARLTSGKASVTLDAKFAQLVNTGVAFHVFLTPNGDCKGLYVAAKHAGGFEVRELGGGAANIDFDYRIVAKRIGHEDERMADVTGQMEKFTRRRGLITQLASIQHAGTAKRIPTPPPIPAQPVFRGPMTTPTIPPPARRASNEVPRR